MTENEAISRIKDHMETHKLTEERAIFIIDALGMAISALKEVQQYREIGTVKELREAKEKQNPKKVLPLTYKPLLEIGWRYECPNCGCAVGENIYHMDVTKDYEYCSMCGQKIE